MTLSNGYDAFIAFPAALGSFMATGVFTAFHDVYRKADTVGEYGYKEDVDHSHKIAQLNYDLNFLNNFIASEEIKLLQEAAEKYKQQNSAVPRSRNTDGGPEVF
jgi:hypothetical protein